MAGNLAFLRFHMEAAEPTAGVFSRERAPLAAAIGTTVDVFTTALAESSLYCARPMISSAAESGLQTHVSIKNVLVAADRHARVINPA